MKIILLSGGSGKRLWPLSNNVEAKQFLKVLKTEDGMPESMLQRIYRQLNSLGLVPSTHIVTSKGQEDIIKHQIGDNVSIICEPDQRDTFPSISLAITYLYSELQVDPEEIVVVLPVDSFVESSFYQLLNKIPDILRNSKADFALIGVTPQFPSDQYGYIVPQIYPEEDYYSIIQFTEKPSQIKAENLIKKQAFWNCGVFSFSLKCMLTYLDNRNLPTLYDQMIDVYDQLPRISFDYEVVEKSNRSVVIPYEGLWRDLGSWDAVAHHLENNVIGKGVISEDSINTHVINELSTPIHVIGVSNSIIVAGPSGILVSDKKKSARIKQMINNDHLLHEERAWGNFRVLDYTISDEGTESLTKIIQVLPGKNISYQKHNYRKEVWTVISGTGECILNNKHFPIKAGDTIQIPLGAKHGVKAITPLQFIEVQLGERTDERDIIRFTFSWEEAIMNVSKED